jgi:hypothetical protein
MSEELEGVIRAGLRYIETAKNTDGGVPATSIGDTSGCWTTAESLEAILISHSAGFDRRPLVLELLAFLERSQFPMHHPDPGAWPIVAGAEVGSTMATGTAISALCLVAAYFAGTAEMSSRARSLSTPGIRWLCDKQNPDGGWSVEPSSHSAPDSRMIATTYALRGLLRGREDPAAGAAVATGLRWIRARQAKRGGFSSRATDPEDACSTARALSTLLQAGDVVPSAELVSKAVDYIMTTRAPRGTWELATETYVTEGAPGQTVFNSNSPSDVLIALVRSQAHRPAQLDLVRWFLAGRAADGSWPLASETRRVDDLRTWPTNEAILALEEFRQSIGPADFTRETHAFSRVAFFGVILLCLVETLLLIDLPHKISTAWDGLSPFVRATIVTGVLLGLAVNVLAAGLYDAIRRHLLGSKRRKSNE